MFLVYHTRYKTSIEKDLAYMYRVLIPRLALGLIPSNNKNKLFF